MNPGNNRSNASELSDRLGAAIPAADLWTSSVSSFALRPIRKPMHDLDSPQIWFIRHAESETKPAEDLR
jgi:hypothetical protein